MEALLQYNHVDISYLGQPVIRDVSFSLRSGEILGIVGESGSGKSTLIKAAMGLLGCEGQVTRGDIWFKGAAKALRPGAWLYLPKLRQCFLPYPYRGRPAV